MKIIISPTKTMKRKNFVPKTTTPIFLDKSDQLRNVLEGYDKDKIKSLFKISDKLTNKVFDFFNKNSEQVSAINLYEGMAFKSMDLDTWDKVDFDFAQEHLLILSAMYGALRPYDMISEYRLDYMVKFEKDLYDYWDQPLNNLLKNEDVIINLASQEFSKQVENNNMITIHLLDEKGRNLSTQAKMGRGDLLKYIVKNKITSPEQIKAYSNLDYKFIEEKSDQHNYFFTKE